MYGLLADIIKWYAKEDSSTGDTLERAFKVESFLPKEGFHESGPAGAGSACVSRIRRAPTWSNRTGFSTFGLPTGGNPHGNRATVKLEGLALKASPTVGNLPEFPGVTGWHAVPTAAAPTVPATMPIFGLPYSLPENKTRGRVAAKLLSNNRNYSTGSAPKVMKKLDSLTSRAREFPQLTIDRNLYELVHNIDMLTLAYNNIKSKPGNMTPGITPETLDGISSERIETLSERLRNESFEFSPGRRVQIPKPSGGTRPLTVAPPMDKIVQEAMRIILNAIFEPTFLDSSHGFRPNRGCHTALKYVHQKFQPSTWIIEGDISKCFDSIDHHELMKIIERKILDRQFTKLIWKSLRAGYFEFATYQHNIAGTPQGSIISPLLANVFLHQLDVYVNEIKMSFDKGDRPRGTTESRRYEQWIAKAKKDGDMEKVCKLAKSKRRIPNTNFHDPHYRRLNYVRYADDWIIGVRGTEEEAKKILDQVSKFCEQTKLKVSDTKTKITNISRNKALFLGTLISRSKHVRHSRMTVSAIKRGSLGLRFEAPIQRIKDKFKAAGFIENNQSHPKFVWLHLNHDQILHLHNAVLRGILNYYSFAHNYGRVVSFSLYILRQACAKLLAAKFSLGSTAKTYREFGKNLKSPNGTMFLNPSYTAPLKFMITASPVIQALYSSKSIAGLYNLNCSVCGSNYRVEMHHVRAMKNLNPKISLIDRLMVKAHRKQIPLCRECHMKKHRGLDPKLVREEA